MSIPRAHSRLSRIHAWRLLAGDQLFTDADDALKWVEDALLRYAHDLTSSLTSWSAAQRIYDRAILQGAFATSVREFARGAVP